MEKLNIIDIGCCTSWDEWLEKTEASLKELGYIKYKQNYKHEDFAYWKKLNGYQIGLLFYDFRKNKELDPMCDVISMQYECMLIDIEDRIDLTVSKNITLDEFEEMAKIFYNAMGKYGR